MAAKIGPVELRNPVNLPSWEQAKRRARQRVEQFARYVIVGVIGGTLAGYWLTGLFTIIGLEMLLPFEIGSDIRPYVVMAWWVETVFGLPVLLAVRLLMGRRPVVYIHAVDPEMGNFGLYKLSLKKWQRMITLNYQGEEEMPHQVETDSGHRAYEVDSYEPKTNTAITSDYAGLTPRQIRGDRSSLSAIRTSLQEMASAGMQADAEKADMAFLAGAAEANEVLRRHEESHLLIKETQKSAWQEFVEGKIGREDLVATLKESEQKRKELMARFEDEPTYDGDGEFDDE